MLFVRENYEIISLHEVSVVFVYFILLYNKTHLGQNSTLSIFYSFCRRFPQKGKIYPFVNALTSCGLRSVMFTSSAILHWLEYSIIKWNDIWTIRRVLQCSALSNALAFVGRLRKRTVKLCHTPIFLWVAVCQFTIFSINFLTKTDELICSTPWFFPRALLAPFSAYLMHILLASSLPLRLGIS